ncbi:hypothetical protein ACN4EK_22765 [Pantanalinema rosaneae CENA516]|uniref:hypothetical protein n=1 Tax=Pantanalinema rosaneae TaxID=1620701 RepID=UPI003D6FAE1F
MNCPFRDCHTPPCQITIHPDRQDVEYCRVCEQWHHISQIGNEMPNVFWMIVTIAIAIMLLTGILNTADRPTYHSPSPSYRLRQ